MALFFSILYLIFFASVTIVSLFILFHLSRYALNRTVALSMAGIFSVVTIILLASNYLLFFSLPFEELFALPMAL